MFHKIGDAHLDFDECFTKIGYAHLDLDERFTKSAMLTAKPQSDAFLSSVAIFARGASVRLAEGQSVRTRGARVLPATQVRTCTT